MTVWPYAAPNSVSTCRRYPPSSCSICWLFDNISIWTYQECLLILGYSMLMLVLVWRIYISWDTCLSIHLACQTWITFVSYIILMNPTILDTLIWTSLQTHLGAASKPAYGWASGPAYGWSRRRIVGLGSIQQCVLSNNGWSIADITSKFSICSWLKEKKWWKIC